VLSSIYQSFIAEDQIKQSLEGFSNLHPIGRIGTVEEIADAIEFFII